MLETREDQGRATLDNVRFHHGDANFLPKVERKIALNLPNMTTPPILRLPDEILLSIANWLMSEGEINALAQTCSSFFSSLDHFLYQRNAQRTGGSALLWAARYDERQTAKKAIKASAERAGVALRISAENGHESLTAFLLNIDSVNIESRNYLGQTPLCLAAKLGHIAIVALLLEEGANTELRDDIGRTPLSHAAENGHECIVRMLLERNTDSDSMDESGRTPVNLAAHNGHEAVVELLLRPARP